MPVSLRLDIASGGAAGLLGGLLFWWALEVQGVAAATSGLLGLKLSGAWLVLHLLASIVIGAGFGALCRYQPLGLGSTISVGLLYGLLWWIAGPITIGALLEGRGPDWSVDSASVAFPSLIAHVFYGGLTGLSFYSLIGLYLRRFPEPEAAVYTVDSPKTRVLILGGGFGGISTARRLEQILWRESNLEIMLVSQSNYLLFTPLLAEVAASALDPHHISSPVRAALPHTRFRRAEVEEIDPEARVVRVRSGDASEMDEIAYDHLVLALGSIPHYFGLPGMERYAFTLKSLQDATDLRNHVIAQLELADVNPKEDDRCCQLGFVVAGGGFAGTEIIAELFDLVHSVLRYYPNVRADELRFVLVHAQDRILPEIGPDLADYALRTLRARGVQILLDTRVAGATPDGVVVNGGQLIPARTVVWTAGNQPNPVLDSLPCELNQAGAVVAEETLRLKGFSNIWAVGDCAHIPDSRHQGRSYPPTAQHAIREGRTAATNIAAALKGRPLKPFRFRTLGLLVPLGHRTGVAEIRGLRFSGLLAWLIWRGVYLSLLPGLEKKVRVLLDWMIDLFFPRDIVLTATRRTQTLPEMIEPHRDGERPIPEPQGVTQARGGQ